MARVINGSVLAKYLMDIPDNEHTLPDEEYIKLFDWVDKIGDLYVNYRQKYVVMKPGSRPRVPKLRTKQGDWYLPLDEKALTSHLLHEQAVCVYAGPLSSKFMCFDVDNGCKDTVYGIINKCAELGVPREMVYVSSSGGKGYHVEIFFFKPMFTDTLKLFYKKVCNDLALDEKKIEFRPTHGQSIKLPLSVHRKTGNVCWFLDRDTLEPIETNDYLYRILRMDDKAFTNLVKDKCCSPETNKIATSKEKIKGEKKETAIPCGGYNFELGWPMLNDSGTRYRTMTAIAVYERNRCVLSKDELMDGLRAWIKKQDPAYLTDSDFDIDYDVRKVCSWVFGPEFHVKSQGASVVFTDDDVSIIANQPSKNKRKFIFLLMFFEKKFGRLKLSSDRIAEYIKCSSILVRRSIVPDLTENGILIKIPGKLKGVLDKVSRESNSYRINRNVGELFLNKRVPCLSDKININERLTPENFDDIYYGLLIKMIPEIELKKHLTKTEIKEIAK